MTRFVGVVQDLLTRMFSRGLSRGQWFGSARAASLGLAALLIVLPAFAIWGALSTYQAGMAAQHASELNGIFEKARYAVGAEESLERKYRLEPSPEVRAKHREAAATLVGALEQVPLIGGVADQALVENVLAMHKNYLLAIDAMFAAIDAQDTARANEIDGAEVDPRFDEMEERVLSAADAHAADATQHLNSLADFQTAVLIATPIVFALGMGLVALFWSVLRAYQRQATEAMTREKTSLLRGEERYRSLVQNASDVVLICTPAGAITYQSPTAETAWGYVHGGLLNQPFFTLIHPDDQPAFLDLWEQLRTVPGASRTIELRLHDVDGALRSNELILTNLLDKPSVEGFVVTARDISERKRFEEQLIRQAFYDSLTRLPNRVLFLDRLKQALARAGRRQESVGLLFLDLDNFKLINDSLGHQVGDELLIEAAARLRACVRDENTVGRLGGDEFVILLDHLADEAEAVLVAERIAEQFARPFVLESRQIVVTASIGIRLSDAGQQQADNMLRDADVAMYRAKSAGKDRHVVFHASMQTDTLARLEIENELRVALERGEMRIHYQPIVLLDSGQISGVEALVRWQHPTRGLVAPNEFIPVAEETGLIVPLGRWVLEEACRQMAAWHANLSATPPLAVSVNLSPRQFQEPALVEEVKRALSKSRLAPSCLKLEITEGVIMRDTEATIKTLWELQELGVKIAVDDFGTGYSSLAYLKRLPLDILKIDRSFVHGIGRNQEDTAIVRAIIAMAKSLDLGLTAEGIETAEQSTLLQAWACDRGQGYYFARPMDAASLTALLARVDNQPRETAQVA